ncbi:hypothetical protein FHX52_1944 [Humibacillus xanthopallidus]|uniref:Coenzyme PQQ synthesis protein D (PqqD) n=1 Tax=Humibacillus xanthopallidus TaxID=412689 RepID=A0A543PXI7_9MICO|nr:hypothetical protein [Humibacillus xanthopallidus]TQN48797.1 hypothetical protein FHX52_1944 [Humibacillus xanthopallidus]
MDAHALATTYRVPSNIAWIDGADFGMREELYLTALPSGQTVLLEDTGRLIWLVAMEGGEVLERVAEVVGLPLAAIESDVTRFLAEVTTRGLLAGSLTLPRSD